MLTRLSKDVTRSGISLMIGREKSLARWQLAAGVGGGRHVGT